jgi:hypothetical protein
LLVSLFVAGQLGEALASIEKTVDLEIHLLEIE